MRVDLIVARLRSRTAALVLDLSKPRERLAAGIATVTLVAAATVALITLLQRPDARDALPPTPHRPAASIAYPNIAPAAAGKPSTRAGTGCTMPPAPGGGMPFHICIPALHVDAAMIPLGLNPDRTVEVPPLSRVADAGWYRYSAQPGDAGPTVILGHVDSARYGEGVSSGWANWPPATESSSRAETAALRPSRSLRSPNNPSAPSRPPRCTGIHPTRACDSSPVGESLMPRPAATTTTSSPTEPWCHFGDRCSDRSARSIARDRKAWH